MAGELLDGAHADWRLACTTSSAEIPLPTLEDGVAIGRRNLGPEYAFVSRNQLLLMLPDDDATGSYLTVTSCSEKTKAVNTDVMMPMPRVTAKPRTGPAPSMNSTAAAMKVVILASRMAASARP